MKKWEVPVVYRGQCNYIIEANTADEARQKAEDLFNGGDMPDALGNEWEKIDYCGEITSVS